MRSRITTALCLALAIGPAALARGEAVNPSATPSANPPAFEDFTFKRVAPPAANATRRITVQIAPSDAPKSRVTDPTEPASAGRPGQPALPMAPFWAAVSPDLDAMDATRLPLALDVLAQLSPDQSPRQPRIQPLQDIARAYGSDILLATIGTRVSPALVLSVIAVESGGQSGAVSEKGAQGLMQLIPATAERFGVDPSVDRDNIRGGVAYLDWLLEKFGGDPMLALAAYNAGENAVIGSGGVPPYAETRTYVPKILNTWRVARGLCATPPELLSDGCVFVVDKAG